MARLGAALMLALALAAAVPARGAAQEIALEDVVIERHGEAVSVRLKTSGPPRHQAQWLDQPPRILIDLADTRYAWKLAQLAGPVEPISQIRGTQLRPGVSRVVIELTRKVSYRVDADPEGLRVSFATGAAEAPARPAREPVHTGPHLYGVVHGNRGWVAYIEDPQSHRVGPYRVGDALAGSVVERIEAESVMLRGPQGPLLLQLGDGRPGLSAR